jgi:hypothetical protein
MDWNLAIARNRDALLRIVAALFALAGLVDGKAAGVLPRPLYRTILRVLRPAESAVRRLIMIAARGLVFTSCAPRPAPTGLHPNPGAPRSVAFPLIDPLKPLSPVAQSLDATDHWTGFEFVDDDTSADDKDGGADFSGGAPSLPRISVPGFFDPVLIVPAAPLAPDFIDASRLTARLQALHRALNNLPREARRLARWLGRRVCDGSHAPLTPMRLSPVRPGAPPGLARRGAHEVHAILRECHLLMLDARDAPDTS